MDLPRAVRPLLPRARRLAPALVLLALLAAAPALRGSDGDKDGPAWPFGPLARPAVPRVHNDGWARNPIDVFVLAKLEAEGLRPSPPADRVTLLRRVTFDLTGLAPTPAERDAFLADRSPDAYERLVDRLLGSPRFGERWAQHWLDLVRYAETEGFKSDRLRPDAYRYRDYVIRAFNDDLPYDRFLRQQLAGDELEPDNPDALVATGFYRLHPEESTASNYRLARQDILDDITDVFGATFLGVTVGCARCHDHKFDPITQQDYYRLQAFFAPLLQRDDLPLASAEEQARYARQLAAWGEATRHIRAELDALIGPVLKQMFDESVPVFDPETQKALRTPEGRRTALQRQLALLASKQIVRKYRRAPRRLKPEQRARYDALQKELARFDALKPAPLPTAMAATDAGPEPPATYLLATGNYQRPRAEERPGFPEFLDGRPPAIRPPAGRPGSTGRRSALARWLCRPDHPLTARVLLNRVWQHYLGQGIVATPNDLGTMGAPPTHPELLDYLAAELVRGGWRLKRLHRLIVTSATYRQASRPESNPGAALAVKADPDNKLLWHARVRRREAESLRDVLLQASGRLNLRMYGPSAQPELPAPVTENYYAWDPDERPADRNRRSVYVFARRNLALPLLAAFDLPDRNSSCPARAATITAPQALAMLNSSFTLRQARHTAGTLLAKHPRDLRGLVREAYRVLFSREPSADELSAAEEFLARQARLIPSGDRTPPAQKAVMPEPMPADVEPKVAAAVVDFCHALLNAAEFLYVE
jgi:hypothetical protein